MIIVHFQNFSLVLYLYVFSKKKKSKIKLLSKSCCQFIIGGEGERERVNASEEKTNK